MNINDAARWANAKNCKYRANPVTGDVEYLYATYCCESHDVLVISWDFDRCNSIAKAHRTGARVESLADVMESIWESDGEQNAIQR